MFGHLLWFFLYPNFSWSIDDEDEKWVLQVLDGNPNLCLDS